MSEIEAEELARRLGELAVIDVRGPGEYDGSFGAPCDPRQGHIPGALNLDLQELMLLSDAGAAGTARAAGRGRARRLLPQRLPLGDRGSDPARPGLRCPQLRGVLARMVANRFPPRTRRRHVSRITVGALLAAALGTLLAGAAAAAHNPSPAQKAAIVAAFRREQGDVAIQAVVVSSANPGFASMNWGFANGGLSAYNNSVLALVGGKWRVLWTREAEQPADGACVHVPAAVAHELLDVSCPPAAKLHARAATAAEVAAFSKSFHSSTLTRYAKSSSGLGRVCVSKLDPAWAAAAASFPSGSSVYVWFRHRTVAFESLVQAGAPPPPWVVLSLASCVGYNASEFGG